MTREHQIEIRVRYGETDAMGHVHHANFFNYFELGRTELLRDLGQSYREFEDSGLMLVVTEIACTYHQPAYFDDLLRLVTLTTRARGASIRHEYRLYRGEQLLATGSSTVVCIARDGGVRRLPQWLVISRDG